MPALITGCPKIIVQHLCDCCERAVDSIISVLHSSLGQASTKSLRPRMSKSEKWLLIDKHFNFEYLPCNILPQLAKPLKRFS